MPTVSVIMPSYKHERFIRRAVESLFAQTLEDWELIIIDDGSPDHTYSAIQPALSDSRVQYYRMLSNQGLGAAINTGLAKAESPLIAYLPSDDVIYSNHLESLVHCLEAHPDANLAYSGVRYNYNRYSDTQTPGFALQLVQVMHRQTPFRWMERGELETDDLERMFWRQLRSHGDFIATEQVTCEWVSHPDQRHKIMHEPVGGINTFRQYYQVKTPLRFHTTVGNYIDEVDHYRRFRERPDTPPAPDGLKILLVGELAYNPERVLALEERGHRLYGLWMPEPYWYNTVGPLPFGHVTDIPYNGWQEAVRRIQPDVIYALLNWQAVPFAHQIMQENPGIPFVWHYKEGPFINLEKGSWNEMIDLYMYSDGQIFCNPEMLSWYETIAPGTVNPETSLILDGDLLKRDWMTDGRSPRLSSMDGEIHTVVPGRPIGLHPQNVVELAEQGIHLHFYGDFMHGQWLEWIEKTMRLAPVHIHLHSNVDQENWVSEFSKYDAGWLHFFESKNHGEIRRADWDDLNYPARISTLAIAGLPMLQRDNSDSIVAMQTLIKRYDAGLFFTNMADLRSQLTDEQRIEQIRTNVWNSRHVFSFDDHVDRLVAFFRKIIQAKATSQKHARFVFQSTSLPAEGNNYQNTTSPLTPSEDSLSGKWTAKNG